MKLTTNRVAVIASKSLGDRQLVERFQANGATEEETKELFRLARKGAQLERAAGVVASLVSHDGARSALNRMSDVVLDRDARQLLNHYIDQQERRDRPPSVPPGAPQDSGAE
jgi:hypothetical protein